MAGQFPHWLTSFSYSTLFVKDDTYYKDDILKLTIFFHRETCLSQQLNSEGFHPLADREFRFLSKTKNKRCLNNDPLCQIPIKNLLGPSHLQVKGQELNYHSLAHNCARRSSSVDSYNQANADFGVAVKCEHYQPLCNQPASVPLKVLLNKTEKRHEKFGNLPGHMC